MFVAVQKEVADRMTASARRATLVFLCRRAFNLL
jgi:16S rRNA A1518/A1519 N6-dimethyltransferase RsmA/KsgA/DIM1 with predicted DNA glycosylase/AP lyase activity